MSEADPSEVLKKYREQFVASVPPDAGKAYRFVEPVAFSFPPQAATEIAQLVLDGVKTELVRPRTVGRRRRLPVAELAANVLEVH